MLNEMVRKIQEWCDKNKIQLFYGFPSGDDQPPVVIWKRDEVHGLPEYLEIVRQLGISLLVVDELKHEWGDDHEDITRLRDFLEESEKDELNELLVELQAFNGSTVSVTLTFFKDNTFFEYSERAEWADRFDELAQFIDEHPGGNDDEYDDVGEDDELPPTKSEIKALAQQLAENKEFQECTKVKEREFVASKIFDEKYDDKRVLRDIIDRATNIVKLEIEPKRKKALRTEIRTLRKQGLSDDEIAERVGISKGRLPWV